LIQISSVRVETQVVVSIRSSDVKLGTWLRLFLPFSLDATAGVAASCHMRVYTPLCLQCSEVSCHNKVRLLAFSWKAGSLTLCVCASISPMYSHVFRRMPGTYFCFNGFVIEVLCFAGRSTFLHSPRRVLFLQIQISSAHAPLYPSTWRVAKRSDCTESVVRAVGFPLSRFFVLSY
jgi:hypothetical protein